MQPHSWWSSNKYISEHSSTLPATDVVIRDMFQHASYVYAVSKLSNRGMVCRSSISLAHTVVSWSQLSHSCRIGQASFCSGVCSVGQCADSSVPAHTHSSRASWHLARWKCRFQQHRMSIAGGIEAIAHHQLQLKLQHKLDVYLLTAILCSRVRFV